jgi:hypothetical protein
VRPGELLLLGGWFTGILFLCAGLTVSRLNRRAGTRPPGFWMSGSDLAANPEKYVSNHALPLVRFLNLVGAALCALAALFLVGVSVARWMR